MSDPLPVLLLHAAGRTPQMWQEQVTAIGGVVPVVAPWLAGLRPGKTATLSLAAAADEVLTVMDRYGMDSARVVGHQLGATVALKMAVTEPQAVAGLVLSGPMLALPKTAMLIHRTVIKLMPKAALAESGATRNDLLDALNLIASADFGKQLGLIDTPALVIAGSNDPDRKTAQHLAQQLGNAEFAVVPDGGSNPSMDAPLEYNSLLLDFLTKTQ